MSELSREDIYELLRLLDSSGYGELRLELGDLKLHISRHPDGAAPSPGAEPGPAELGLAREPAAASAEAARSRAEAEPAVAPAGAPAAPAEEVPDGLVAVRAPMLGAFYRAPAPDQAPFVDVGDHVEPDQDVCLIEVMKLFNSIKAGTAGRVVEIRAENGAMVEYDEILVLVEPDPS